MAVKGPGCEQAMVTHQMGSGLRNECGQSGDKVLRLEQAMGRAVMKWAFEL